MKQNILYLMDIHSTPPLFLAFPYGFWTTHQLLEIPIYGMQNDSFHFGSLLPFKMDLLL